MRKEITKCIKQDSKNNEKTRQNTENKQSLEITRNIEVYEKKLVKTLKINKLMILREKLGAPEF